MPTNRHIIARRGLLPLDERWIGLEEFDAVEVEILPGQEWLHAGDLIFKQSGTEVFRLAGVPRPDVFRRVCLTAARGRGPRPRGDAAGIGPFSWRLFTDRSCSATSSVVGWIGRCCWLVQQRGKHGWASQPWHPQCTMDELYAVCLCLPTSQSKIGAAT